MFLSVIVSCYNCRPYIKRLLNSLVIQDFDDMEVIISDDNSTDNFMEIVENYKSLLNIKYFKTEHQIHCPGNTRLDGWKHASGEWITFMDHDDEFLPNAFKTVYEQLKANSTYNIPFVFSPVQRMEPGNKSKLLHAVTWLHGNFYKKDFLIQNNINFKEDLFGNEDLYFNNLVNGIVVGKGLSILKLDNPLYQWNYNEKSLSNTREDLEYTEKYFGDYLISNSEPHIRCYREFPNKSEHFKKEMLQAILYSYFYYQRALFRNKKSKLKDMFQAIKDTYNIVSKELNITKKDLLSYLTADINKYNDSRSVIMSLSGQFIEQQSLEQFIKSL